MVLLLRFAWRVIWRRPIFKMLLWVVLTLVRRFGWRRSAKFAFAQRRRGYAAVRGLWRAAVRLLRLGRSVWTLIAWVRRNLPRLLRGGGTQALRSASVPQDRRLRAPYVTRSLDTQRPVRPNLSSRVARRRDEVRRSLLAAMGVDPNWRPNRQPRGGPVNGPKNHSRP